jgi:hypothetical protein
MAVTAVTVMMRTISTKTAQVILILMLEKIMGISLDNNLLIYLNIHGLSSINNCAKCWCSYPDSRQLSQCNFFAAEDALSCVIMENRFFDFRQIHSKRGSI